MDPLKEFLKRAQKSLFSKLCFQTDAAAYEIQTIYNY